MTDYQKAERARSFFLLILFLVLIVMLNLLIAIMADSYEKVKEGETLEARKLRVETIIDEDAMMRKADKRNPDYFPDYLQLLQSTEAQESVWSGLSGKINSEFTAVDQTIRTMERSIMDEIDQKIRSLEQSSRTDMEASRAEVRSTADSVQKLATKDEVQKVRDDVAGLRGAIDAQTEMMQKLLQLLPSEQPVAAAGATG
jgi:hypothetical protein|eukprot:COSAG06_NODE_20309_length_800_cov_1.396576_1_plen_200_part_00